MADIRADAAFQSRGAQPMLVLPGAEGASYPFGPPGSRVIEFDAGGGPRRAGFGALANWAVELRR